MENEYERSLQGVVQKFSEKEQAFRDRDFYAARNLENAAEFLRKGWHDCALFLISEIDKAYKEVKPKKH